VGELDLKNGKKKMTCKIAGQGERDQSSEKRFQPEVLFKRRGQRSGKKIRMKRDALIGAGNLGRRNSRRRTDWLAYGRAVNSGCGWIS